jgi:hypothetical protein
LLCLKKSAGGRGGSTGIRQTGAALFAAQPGWLMTLESGRRSLDNKKSAGGRGDSTGIRQTGEAALFAACPVLAIAVEGAFDGTYMKS